MEQSELVSRRCLENVMAEVAKIKEWIPQMINADVVHAYKTYPTVQRELLVLHEEHKKLKADVTRWKNKCESAQAELRLEKEMHRDAKMEVAGLKEQLSMEVRYCAKLGSSSCGLLWSLSKRGVPHSTIHTSCMKTFLDTFEQTIVNFTHVDSNVDSDSDEMKLVEGLCGTLVNISASEEGRDYLVESEGGKNVISTIVSLIASLPPAVLRLLLMLLYNVAIQYNGQAMLLKLVEGPVLDTTICKSRDVQVIVGCLRLLQSLEQEHVIVSTETILFCSSHQHRDVREFARDLFGDKSGGHEP